MLTVALAVAAIIAAAGTVWSLAVWIHVVRSDLLWRQIRRELAERPPRPLTWL